MIRLRPWWTAPVLALSALAAMADGVLLASLGLPALSIALAALGLALFFVGNPASFLLLITFINSFINVFSTTVSIPLGLLSLNPSQLLAILIMVIGFLALLRRPPSLERLRPVAVPLLALDIILILSSFFAGRFALEHTIVWSRYPTFLILLVLAFHTLKTETLVRRTVAILSWTSVIPIAVGLYQAFTGTGPERIPGVGTVRIYGTWFHPNPYSFYLLMLFPLSLVTLLEARTSRRRILSGAWCGLIATSIFLTYTRIAWIGLAVEISAISLLRKNWRLLMGFVVLAGALLVAVPSARLRLADLGQVQWQNPERHGNSVEWRLATWREAISEGTGRLLIGYGASATRDILRSDAHNDYLAIMIEGGVLGLLAYVWLQGALLAGSLRAYRRLHSPLHRRLALTLVVILCAFDVMSLTDNIVGYFQLYTYLWILVGLVWALPVVEAAQAVRDGAAGMVETVTR